MTKEKISFAKEIRLLFYVCGLYTAFVYWGYLQEKITSTQYEIILENQNRKIKWQFPFTLNLLMALATFIVSGIGELIYPSPEKIPLWVYAKPAITCALASPIGYIALDYISFPLVVLTKSSKPVPVMLVGIFLYKKQYPWYKYVSVLLLCGGITLFSFGKSGKAKDIEFWTQILGIFLVGVNVFLDGYTNNEQDHVFEKYKATSLQMMKNVNFWQIIYLICYLLGGYMIFFVESELYNASILFLNSSLIREDILMFCISASVGQLFIFAVMKEFGSLMWVTLSITRKLFTIVVSVIMFNHSISAFQWIGVAAVFGGMTLEVVMNYRQEKAPKKSHFIH
jgi:UDP-galactose transporter B1